MVKRHVPLLAAILLTASLIGCSANVSDKGSQPSSVHEHSEASRKPAVQDEEKKTYSLDATVTKEADGYYLHIVTDYKLTMEGYNGAPVEGEGHIHFHLNGALVGPIAQTEPYLISNPKEGENKIKLDLARHDHSVLGVSKELVFENEK